MWADGAVGERYKNPPQVGETAFTQLSMKNDQPIYPKLNLRFFRVMDPLLVPFNLPLPPKPCENTSEEKSQNRKLQEYDGSKFPPCAAKVERITKIYQIHLCLHSLSLWDCNICISPPLNRITFLYFPPTKKDRKTTKPLKNLFKQVLQKQVFQNLEKKATRFSHFRLKKPCTQLLTPIRRLGAQAGHKTCV